MKEKTKAIELVDKFKPLVYCYMGSGMLSNSYDDNVILENAKRCAIICVDVILNDCGAKNWKNDEMTGNNYWANVKQEIEKL